VTAPGHTFNRRGGSEPTSGTQAYADEWGQAARTEVDTVKKAIAVAAHAECLRLVRRERSGRA
jgi:hypothetical protein